MLHLLKRGMERRGKKLLGLGVVAAINDTKGVLTAAVALPEIEDAWPSNGAGAGARGERGVGIGVGGESEENKLLRTRG